MQYLFFAASGTGKSEVATLMLEPFLRNKSEVHMDTKGYFQFLRYSPKQRLKMCHAKIKHLNATREEKFPFPEHVVQSNEKIWTKKHGRLITNYDMPGDKNGLYDENYETYCPPPFSIIRWDEAQKEVNGRDSQGMPPRVSALCQTHRKWGLDILYFTQRSKILDLNVRDNAIISEIEEVVHKTDKYGFIISTEAKFKVFFSLPELESYLSTGKKTYKRTSYIDDKNAHKHYDSNEGEEHYIYLADKRGINLKKPPENDSSADGIEEYIKTHPYTPIMDYRKISQTELRRRERERQKTQDTKETA